MLEAKVRIKDITRDYISGNIKTTLEFVDGIKPDALNFRGDVRVVMKDWREKRSLDANGYYWLLLSAMAEVLDTSKEELHEEMLRRYGKPYEDEEGYVVATLPAHVDINKVEGHWKRFESNGKFTAYIMLKGTSQYDTKEMSYLLERIVEEAKDLGIETMTPDEIERLKLYEK